MAFNVDKCEVLCITNKKRPIQQDYFIHDQKLATSSKAKFLEQTCSQHLQESKLHHGFPETQHQTSLPASKEHSLQEFCQINSQILLLSFTQFGSPTLKRTETNLRWCRGELSNLSKATTDAQVVLLPCVRTSVGTPCNNTETTHVYP